MAGNTRKRNMDLTTRDSLRALDMALAMIPNDVKRDDEFTANEFHARRQEANPNMPVKSSKYYLDCLVAEGKLQKRKVLFDGKITCAYSIVNGK